MKRNKAMHEINVPFFPGFYGSPMEYATNYELESHVDYLADLQSDDESYPEGFLKLSEFDQAKTLEKYSDKLYSSVDWTSAHKAMATDWVETMLNYVETETGIKFCASSNVDLVSPREYNFSTDRVFVKIRYSAIRHMYKTVMRTVDSRKIMSDMVAQRFTSRSGFISHYKATLTDWSSDLREWDHNELGTLLEAFLLVSMGNGGFDGMVEFLNHDSATDWVMSCFHGFVDWDGAWSVWCEAVAEILEG
jgi:hypothetical protein